MSDQTPTPGATPEPTPEAIPTPTPQPTPAPTPAPAETTAPQPVAPATAAGAAAPPPAAPAPATAQPPSGGGPFKSGKQKTIAMIVAGVVVVGGLGGVIGAMAGGGGDDNKNVAAPGEGGSGILNPTPVGNTNPDPEPTVEPTAEPTPGPTDAPPPPGDGVSLGGVTTVPVPTGWSVLGEGEADLFMGDEQGSWVYALLKQADPSTDAGSLLSQVVPEVLPSELYSQLQLGDVAPLQPFGSLVSVAVVDYRALWVDAQAPIELYGRMFAGVRQDGVALIMTAEHDPPNGFDASQSSWAPIIDGAFNTFAGI